MSQPDRCPYHRSLSRDFEGCEAFQPTEYHGVDVHFRPVEPVWTCRYLQTAPAGRGEFYPSCSLGSAAQREAALRRLRSDRLELFRTLNVELSETLRPHVLELLEAKAHRAARGETLHPEDDAEVGELVRLAMTHVDAVLSMRAGDLQRLRIPEDACHDLVEWVLLEIGKRSDFAFPAFPKTLLARVPGEVADMLAAYRG